MTLFDKLHNIIFRDNRGMTIVEGDDPRFCAITYHDVQGTDDYRVEYFDNRPQVIEHQWQRVTRGHTRFPWIEEWCNRAPTMLAKDAEDGG